MTRTRLFGYVAALALVGGALYLLLPGTPVTERTAQSRRETQRSRGTASGGIARLPALGTTASAQGPDATPIAGRVLDASSGEAITGVHLTFAARGAQYGAVTHSEGRYELRLPPGTYDVALVAEGHAAPDPAPRVQVLAGDPVQWLDFRLHAAATVAGRVVGGGGEPLAAAAVGVQRPSAGSTAAPRSRGKVLTDPRGRFSLAVPPGEVTLRAEAAGRGAALGPRLYLEPGAHVEGVVITVAPSASLSGQILAPGGRRVRGGTVLVQDAVGTHRIPCDQDGGFAAAGLGAGTKLIQAAAPGFSPSQLLRVRLDANQPRQVVLHVALAQGVSGVVLDEQEQPVAGARVTVRPGSAASRQRALFPPAESRTGASGAFSITGVASTPLVVSAEAPTGERASRAGVPPGTRDLVLRLAPGGSIVGRVTAGDSGKPVRDFTVRLTGATGTGTPYGDRQAQRVVSAAGAFQLDDLPPGSYGLEVTAPGYGAHSFKGISVVAGHTARVTAVLHESGRVAGVVVDERGTGIPGALVRMDSGGGGLPVVSAASGEFELADVARGRRSLTATHPDYDTRIASGVSVFPGKTAQVRVELAARSGSRAGLKLSGIGAVLSDVRGSVTVAKVIAGSPAEVAGLQARDVILSVDGTRCAGAPFAETIEAIRGVIGTPVRLQLSRDEREFEVNVIRDEVTVPGKS